MDLCGLLPGDWGCKIDLMNARLIERGGHRLLVADATGPSIGRGQDALDLISESWTQKAPTIVVPLARFDPDFFRLRSGLAGEFVQKMATYRRKLAIIGDIAAKTAESDSLRDFVREANRGNDLFFLPDMDALVAKLTTAATPRA